MWSLSIRWKLTAWYGAALAVVLCVFGTIVYLTTRHQLRERVDDGLKEELADVLYEVRRAEDDRSLSGWLDHRFAHHEGFDFQITRPDASRFFYSDRLSETTLPLAPASVDPAYRDVKIGTMHWRVITVEVPGPVGSLTIQVARSLAQVHHELQELLFTFLLAGPLSLLATIAGGYALARRALKPVDRMRRAADEITAERLARRISVANPDDELGALARTLNAMIARLEKSFGDMQRFTADAAHELRTPLAVIRNEAEVALRTDRPSEEYRRTLENVLDEATRLGTLAERLLFLSRQDAGLNRPANEEVAGDTLLAGVVSNMQIVAQEKGVQLLLKRNDSCRLESDATLIRRVLYNLLDNAIKYTPAGGEVKVTSFSEAGHWQVEVADTGVGISQEHLPHIFDRFYRVDPARAEGSGGAGLGLAISRAIVMNLRGQITLESVVGRGTTARFVLPLHRENDLSQG
jgi:heavy metal sensor kinase